MSKSSASLALEKRRAELVPHLVQLSEHAWLSVAEDVSNVGMIVGENSRVEDMAVNVCKKKHVTNTRAAGSDDALKLTPPRQLSLEQCLEFIADDELLEVTPNNLRMRKKILDAGLRAKSRNSK